MPVSPTDVPALVGANIQSVPDRFLQLMRPVQINGTILSLQDNGSFTFRTAAGDLLLNLIARTEGAGNSLAELLTPFVQNQKPISLAIQPGSPPTQAFLSVPAPALTIASLTSAAAVKTTPQPAQASAVFTPGSVITAVVLPEGVAKAFAANPSAISEFPSFKLSGLSGEIAVQTTEASSGISLGGFLTSPQKWQQLADFLKTPLTGETASTIKAFVSDAPPVSVATETAAQVQTAAPQAGQNPIAAMLKSGSEWNVRLDSILPPNAQPPAAETSGQIVAAVVGKGPDGQLLLNAGDTTLYIRQSGNVAVGSRLLLTLLSPKEEPGFTLPLFAGPEFTAMHNLMAALRAIEPQLAHQFMQTRIPQLNETLPGTLLLLFNILQQGGVQGWLGEDVNARLIRAGKIDLIAKLTEEMQKESGVARDPAVGQWRSWPVPLYDGSQFQMLHLYVRRERDRKQSAGGYPVSPQTRFLITMNMSRLGAVQMDGLSQKKQLDLVIRSENELPGHLPKDLRALYIKTLDALGLTGGLNFQTGRQNWVAVQKVAETAGMVT
ncbi:MAG: hypothetical protein PHY92_03095 [Alphaproteobacteria bacterium]|nr:hypothetical protein [Alphaproteobacteria bacterium]